MSNNLAETPPLEVAPVFVDSTTLVATESLHSLFDLLEQVTSLEVFLHPAWPADGSASAIC